MLQELEEAQKKDKIYGILVLKKRACLKTGLSIKQVNNWIRRQKNMSEEKRKKVMKYRFLNSLYKLGIEASKNLDQMEELKFSMGIDLNQIKEFFRKKKLRSEKARNIK